MPNAIRLRGRTILHNMDQRQGRLALGQIVAEMFSRLGLRPGIIEHIIDELERRPQVHAIRRERLLDLGGPTAQEGTKTRGRFEELCRLEMNDLQIPRLIDIGIMAIHELQHFALGNDIGRIGKHLHDAQIADLHHHLEGAGIKKIPDKHAGRVAKQGIGRVPTAPQARLIDDVVMQQGRCMDKLDHGRQLMVMRAAIPQRTGGKQHQRRSQALAATLDDVLGDLSHQNDIGMQTRPNDGIDRLHILADEAVEVLEFQLRVPEGKPPNLRGPARRRQEDPPAGSTLPTPVAAEVFDFHEKAGIMRGSLQYFFTVLLESNMYAVIKTGGKQYRVAAGEKLKIEQIPAEVGAEITLDQILMVGEGESVKIGAPLVVGAAVKATVLSQGRHDKVKIFKMRRRKHYQKHQGHRQNYTEIRIDGISA